MKRILIVLCLILAGCERPPVRGIVMKKQYRPAWIQTTFVMVGKVMVPQIIHHPEQWDIVIQPDGTHGSDACCLVVVSEHRFRELEVGDVWEREDTIKE